jgi:hypothetical protein
LLEVAVAIISIVLAIPGGIVGYKKLIKRTNKSKTTRSSSGRGFVKNFNIPRKIRIGSWSEVSAIYVGSVESGFFDLIITDCHGTSQWFGDYNGSIEGRHLDTGEYIETGKLNFTNGRYEGRWKFKPESPLKPGKAKAEVGMFEDKDFVSVDGKTMSHRPHIDMQEKDVILY